MTAWAANIRLDSICRMPQIQSAQANLRSVRSQLKQSELQVGRTKEELGLPVLDPPQEARVVRRAAELAREAGVDEELVRDVIWRIVASARDAQEGRTRWGPPLPEPDKPPE